MDDPHPSATATAFAAFAQDAPQTHAEPAVQRREHDAVRLCWKYANQPRKRPIHVGDDALQRLCPTCDASSRRSVSFSFSRLFVAGPVAMPLGAAKVIAQEVEAVRARVHDPRLRRMQREAVVRHPRLHQRQGPLGLFRRAAEDHEVVGVAHHLEARVGQQMVQRIEIDVAQQRTEDRPLRSAGLGRPLLGDPSRMPALRNVSISDSTGPSAILFSRRAISRSCGIESK